MDTSGSSTAVLLRFPNILGVSLASVEPDEADNPVAIRLLSPIGVVVVSQNLPDLIHEFQPTVRLELHIAFHFFRSYNPESGK